MKEKKYAILRNPENYLEINNYFNNSPRCDYFSGSYCDPVGYINFIVRGDRIIRSNAEALGRGFKVLKSVKDIELLFKKKLKII